MTAARTRWLKDRLLTRVVGPALKRLKQPKTSPLVELDWDTCIVLDACRYDLFADVYEEAGIPGHFSKRQSRATATGEFLRENFAGRQHHDTIYVSANPFTGTVDLDCHAVVQAWDTHWDDDLQTVPPEALTEVAVKTIAEYPNKRVVVHYLQPHEPFIGDARTVSWDAMPAREAALGNDVPGTDERGALAFDRLQAGDLTRAEVWTAYRSNLKRALDSVADLLDVIDGKTVVTSDHGNGFGEWAWPLPHRIYGHPEGLYHRALTDVPYLVHKSGTRPTIRSDPPTSARESASADVTDRLASLGYREGEPV